MFHHRHITMDYDFCCHIFARVNVCLHAKPKSTLIFPSLFYSSLFFLSISVSPLSVFRLFLRERHAK